MVTKGPYMRRNINKCSSIFVFSCFQSTKWLGYIDPKIKIFEKNCSLNENLGCFDESFSYISFIIKNYRKLDGKIIFTHGHETSWHYKTPIQTQLKKVMASSYYRNNSFGGIYCNTNTFFTLGSWSGNMGKTEEWYWEKMFEGTHLKKPNKFKYPCCGTFFVDSSLILKHKITFYKKILENMKNFEHAYKKKRLCGRVIEAAWATIFLGNKEYKKPPYCSF